MLWKEQGDVCDAAWGKGGVGECGTNRIADNPTYTGPNPEMESLRI